MSKAVIVTGASRGIGSALAQEFGNAGYNVLINYNSSENEASALKSRIANSEIFCADVSCRNQVDDMIDFCMKKFGKIDVLINNAGISGFKLFNEITCDEWDNMINVNLKGAFNCCQSVLGCMLHNKSGKIINISSVWGLCGASCEVHYSTAKAGIIGLTKALAKELAPSNIQVNCIAPGVIDTDMNKCLTQQEMQLLINEIPAGRMGSPLDVASCALFLADDKTNYITGQVISPNGGFVI
ncbi:MAG: 3-oxoacyl-ACP reductase FabG [Firmicutes bacterium]|nr:3-oxoacyl-ACP reductase FabG [Bacillota bacterium]